MSDMYNVSEFGLYDGDEFDGIHGVLLQVFIMWVMSGMYTIGDFDDVYGMLFRICIR